MGNTLDFLDKELIKSAERVLDDIGMDINTLIRMTLKRVIKEEGISFLILDTYEKKDMLEAEENKMLDENGKMTKNRAIVLLKSEGIVFNKNITYASKNRSANNYWANPDFSVLQDEWYLILNDWLHRELYLFVIPRNEIQPSELVPRNDKEHLIDLQIMYDDLTFTDMRSKLSFVRYLAKTKKY